MRFSVFIEENLDAIVAEWEGFARTLLPAAKTLSDLVRMALTAGVFQSNPDAS